MFTFLSLFSLLAIWHVSQHPRKLTMSVSFPMLASLQADEVSDVSILASSSFSPMLAFSQADYVLKQVPIVSPFSAYS
jgi:hypothetical protein